MDKQIFVQNIKMYCGQKGIKPTVACRDSGVGTSFINNIEARGQVPSVEKVQMLASYLGVTTSELLGEELPRGPNPQAPADLTAEEIDMVTAYRAADDRAKSMVDLALEPWKKSESAKGAM